LSSVPFLSPFPLPQVKWKPPFWYVKDLDFERYEKQLKRDAIKAEQAKAKLKKVEGKILKRKELYLKEVENAKNDYSEQLIKIYDMKDKIEAEMRKGEARTARNDRMKVLKEKIEAVDTELAEFILEHPELYEGQEGLLQ
jgi:hypothetical protein